MTESNDEHTFRRLEPEADAWYECTQCEEKFYTKDAARKHHRVKDIEPIREKKRELRGE